jgi:hypothetical protein
MYTKNNTKEMIGVVCDGEEEGREEEEEEEEDGEEEEEKVFSIHVLLFL